MSAPTLRPPSVQRNPPIMSKAEIAASAVAAKPTAAPAETTLMSPPLDAILRAFKLDGKEDKEMLKLLLQAKAKEDERLAALDLYRTEQLRAASTVAQQQYYLHCQQVYAAQYSAAQSQAFRGPPPYSPTGSPPSSLSLTVPGIAKRPRAGSDASSTSAASDGSASKKSKTSDKPSHEDVMAALRRKCEGNLQTQSGQPFHAHHSASPNHFPAALPGQRPIAPRSPPSLSPPLAAPPTARRTSPPQTSSRHTSFLRPAAPLSGTSTSAPAPVSHSTSAPLSSVPEEPHPDRHRHQLAPGNKLALLLHASETTEAAAGALTSPNWQPPLPQVLAAATSDVRGAA
ncbi:hypothetical protein JCM11641_001300 [Rhodosporidiobolus odoratus]